MTRKFRPHKLTDKQLLDDAWRELQGAPRTKTFDTVSSSRSRAFSAKWSGICGRCGRFIKPGDDVRFVEGYDAVVHDGCRAPTVTVTKMTKEPSIVAGTREPTVCSECQLIHSGECW
jgi:hypothetical protein